MHYFQKIIPIIILSSVATSFTAIAASVTKNLTYQAKYAVEDVEIDGKLNDAPWQRANKTSPFIIHNSGKLAEQNTYAKITYDQNNLYLAFIIEDTDIVANFTENQSLLFKQDDVIELFIAPFGAKTPYLELGISPKNVTYSFKILETKKGAFKSEVVELENFSSHVQINGSLNQPNDIDHSWQVEIKIPFNTLDKLFAQNNKTNWRFNLYRIDFSNDLPRSANEYNSWNVIGSFGFHQPIRFGHLVFEQSEL